MKDEKHNVKRWIFWFSLALAVIILYNVLSNFANVTNWISNLIGILMPFIAGIIIAYILYLPCRSIESLYKKTKPKNFIHKHSRALSIATVYIMALMIIVILINVIVPTLIQSLTDLITNIPNYYNSIIQNINELPEDNILRSEPVKQIIENIQSIDFKSLFDLEKIQGYISSVINAVGTIFNIFISVIVSIYILSQRKQIVSFLSRCTNALFNEKTYNKIKKIFNKGNEIFFKFLTSQIIDAILVGILVSIAMAILGVKYAMLLGFMIGLFNLIPYFGAIIAVVIAVFITILTGGIGQAAIMAVVVIILQQIDANIINPRIVGDSLNISPLLVIFAVTIGGAYFGVLGMFLGVPIIAVIKMILEDFINEKEQLKSAKKVKATIDK
ncbi:MAG: AI-2E family transporter [Clostridia bacterium]